MVGTRSTTPLRPNARQTRSAVTPSRPRVDYHLLNSSGQKQNKPTFENRFGASQLSLSPLEENINKVNQSWNDDACTDLKEKDGKGTEKEKEKENEAEKEKEEDGEKEEEEERENDVGEKQKERHVEEDVVRHMDFTDGDSFKQPVEHLSVSEDSSVLILSNTPPGTEKSKEKTKYSSQKKKAVTTPGKGEARLNWPVYTPFIHDAIIDLYVSDEPDEHGEFMMKKDFYYGKVSMDEFFRDVAVTTMKNVLTEKEKREREEKRAGVKEEKTTVEEEKTTVEEEKTTVEEEKKVDLEALRSYEQLAWDPTNITRRQPPEDEVVQKKQCRNFKLAMKGDASVGTGLFGIKSYENVKLEPTYQTGQKDGPKMTKEAKIIRVMYPFFKKSAAWKCHRNDCITRDEEKRKGWPKPLTAKELKIELKLKEKEAMKKRKSEASTRSGFKNGPYASQIDESNDGEIWDEEEAQAEEPDPENSDLTVPRQRKKKRASSTSRGFICNPNGEDELEEKLKEVLGGIDEHAKAELAFKKESHAELMKQKEKDDNRKHELLLASLNVLSQSMNTIASAIVAKKRE